MEILLPGTKAPDFTLQDQYGIEHCLSHYRGLWVILCFIPNDYNSSCVKEACSIRDDFAAIQDREAELFGINMEGISGLTRFTDRYRINFPLLSDRNGKVCEKFNMLWSLGPVKIIRRNSVIISPSGDIVRIYRRVHPNQHSKQLVNDLDLMQQTFVPEQKATLA